MTIFSLFFRKDLKTVWKRGWICLQVYEFNDQTGFAVEYEMTSDSELVDLTLQLEFLYNEDGYKITSIDVDPG